MNDGTPRITVRWRPTKYQELLADNTLWNYKATDLVHIILGTATRAVIYPWKAAPGVTPAIPFINLTPEHIPDDIGLKTPPTNPAKVFIFSFRLCLAAGPREWLKNCNTKQNLETHHAELSLSNASSDSGDITTAGFIFFKNIPPSLTDSFISKNSAKNFPSNSILQHIPQQENTNRKNCSSSDCQMRRKLRWNPN